MARELGGPQVYKDWFRDDAQIPGWVVEWQMGRGQNGELVVSALRIYMKQGDPPVFGDDAVFSGAAWVKFWRAWAQHKEPMIPGAGITSEMLRKVRLGTARRGGATAIRRGDETLAAPSPAAPAARPGRRPQRSMQWWRALAKRRDEVRRSRPHDYAAVLAQEYGMSRTNMRSKLHELRNNPRLNMPEQYEPPPTATQVSATAVQQNRRKR